MNRRKAREYALRQLFKREFAPEAQDDSLQIPEHEVGVGEKGFAGELVRGTLEHESEIDAIIQRAAEHWEIDRMAVVDRNILRCATYELIYRNDIPPAVTINEALEVAKKYSSLDSVAFINGLLDKIAQTHGKKQDK